jgi:3D (Asp-Asp-Asp) domain-containing protein
MEIKVVRVVQKIVVETQPIAFNTVKKVSHNLRAGMTRLSSEGQRGEKHIVYSVKAEDGKVIHRKLLNTKVARKPMDRVILVGPSGLNTSRGLIETKRSLSMMATAYDPGPRSCGKYATGRTSTGMRAGYGVVAVDPRHIALGSRLFIEGYGFAIAGDTGGAIKGHRIDLGYSTHSAAMRFGRKRVTVHVLK